MKIMCHGADMTEKELKQLNRRQLLEMLLAQTERADRLQEQVELLQAELDSKELKIKEAGSLAEASLKLCGIFEAADEAARLYLENVRLLHSETETVDTTQHEDTDITEDGE